MNLSSKLIVISFFLFKSVALASEKYSLYKCDSLKNSQLCKKGCEKIGKISFDVRPVSRPNEVSLIQYLGKEKSPNNLKNCTIVDKFNWNCKHEGSYSTNVHTMIKSKYRWQIIYKMLDGNDDITHGCSR